MEIIYNDSTRNKHNEYCYNTSVQNPLLEVLNRAKGLNEEHPHSVPRKVFALLSYVKVRQSHYRVPGGSGSQISRQSAHNSGKVVSPTHRPPLPPGNIPWHLFLLEADSPQGHSAAGKITSMNNSTQSESNPRPSGLLRSASSNCVTRCPFKLCTVD